MGHSREGRSQYVFLQLLGSSGFRFDKQGKNREDAQTAMFLCSFLCYIPQTGKFTLCLLLSDSYALSELLNQSRYLSHTDFLRFASSYNATFTITRQEIRQLSIGCSDPRRCLTLLRTIRSLSSYSYLIPEKRSILPANWERHIGKVTRCKPAVKFVVLYFIRILPFHVFVRVRVTTGALKEALRVKHDRPYQFSRSPHDIR